MKNIVVKKNNYKRMRKDYWPECESSCEWRKCVKDEENWGKGFLLCVIFCWINLMAGRESGSSRSLNVPNKFEENWYKFLLRYSPNKTNIIILVSPFFIWTKHSNISIMEGTKTFHHSNSEGNKYKESKKRENRTTNTK